MSLRTSELMAGLEALENSLDRNGLLPEYDEYEFRTHAAKSMYTSSESDYFALHLCDGVSKQPNDQEDDTYSRNLHS